MDVFFAMVSHGGAQFHFRLIRDQDGYWKYEADCLQRHIGEKENNDVVSSCVLQVWQHWPLCW